ncbi:hypothetical protein Tco_1508507 [Tanacetum coccineum]
MFSRRPSNRHGDAKDALSSFGEIEALFIQLTVVSFVFVKSDGVPELLDANGWNDGGSGESFEEVGVLQDVHSYLEYGIGLSSFHIQETITFSYWDPFVTRQDLLTRPSRILEANPLLILKTFECVWLHTLHAKPQENEFESFSGQCLSKYIRQLILCPHEIQLNHSLFHLFFDEMMSDVDVFRPGVLDIVAAESYGTLVVTIQRDVIVCKAII